MRKEILVFIKESYVRDAQAYIGQLSDDSFNADWDSPYDVKEYGEYNVHERRLI